MSSNSDDTNLPAFTNIFRQQTVSKSKPIPTNYKSNINYISQSRLTRTRAPISQQDSFESFYFNPKLEDELYADNYDPPCIKHKHKSLYNQNQRNNSYEKISSSNTNNNLNTNDTNHRRLSNSSPLSKTPDSSTDIGNWIDIPDSGIGGGGSSGIGGGGSVGTIGDSDHEMIESNNQSINHDDELENDWAVEELDSIQTLLLTNDNQSPQKQIEDYTTKRLKTFVATTLHNEYAYLDKISKLRCFHAYLQENFNGSQTDINILFSEILNIFKSHQIVVFKLQDFLESFNDLSRPHIKNQSSNLFIKETFLTSALQLLANITTASFEVYLEFVENYPRSMSLLNKLENSHSSLKSGLLQLTKRKSFIDCQNDFNNKVLNHKSLKNEKKSSFFNFNSKKRDAFNTDEFDLYYNNSKAAENEQIDTAKIFTEEILHRPTKLFLFIHSLKDECLNAAKELPLSSSNGLRSNIKSMFDNEESKNLRDKVFEQIKLNIMPKEARKHEDVVELTESNNERKLRHLILYGDCLVCCRLKKDKRQLKWFIPIDKLEIALDDYKSAKSENELRNLRSELVILREQINKEQNASNRIQQRIKKKLAEHENELTIQSSRLKLIIRSNPSLNYASTSGSCSSCSSPKTNLLTTLGNSLTNVSLTPQTTNFHYNHHSNNSTQNLTTSQYSNLSTLSSNQNSQYVFLFTSDFERMAWLEEMNSAIFAYKTRKTHILLQQSDIESRINSMKKLEEPPKVIASSCTGSLELLIKQLDNLSQPNKVYVAVELKSLGSYLEVAKTKSSGMGTSTPVWNEKFTLELQCVDSLRIILYGETNEKALAISSQELKIDSSINLNKINCAKLNNGLTIQISMKFLSPKKTITRRRTRNRNDIFGGNLADLLQREKTSIPRILKDCVEVIETRGIDEVGIYRVSSVVSEVQKMKDLYSKNPNLAHGELKQKSPHLSANVLKLYLRELPDPLFTSHLYQRFIDALEISVPEFRAVELCRIFSELPESNKTIILFILTHLLNISLRSDKNMMGLQNLCTLFGPTLMKLSPKDNLQVDDMAREIKESMQQAQALFYILKLHEENRLLVDADQNDKLNKIAQIQNKTILNGIGSKIDMNNKQNSKSNNASPVKCYEHTQPKNDRSSRANMQTAL